MLCGKECVTKGGGVDGTSMDGKTASGGGLGGGVSVQALGKYGTRDEGDKANGGTLIEERGQ